MAEGNNTIGNNRFNSVDVKPPLNLPKGSPLEKSLAKEKEDFFKKSQTEREKVGKETIGSLAGSKTTIITEDIGSSVRFRQVKNGILKETDKVNSGDEVTLMGRYLMHEIDGSNHGLLKVQLADGREGYIAATHLSSIGDTPAPKPRVPEPTPKPTPKSPEPAPKPKVPEPTPAPEVPTGKNAEWMKKNIIGTNLSQTFKNSQNATYGDLTLDDILDKLRLEDATDETYKQNLVLLKKEAEKVKTALVNTRDKGTRKYELENILATKLKEAQKGNIITLPKPTPKPGPTPTPKPVPGEGPKPSPDYPIGKSGKPIAKLTGTPNRVTSPYPPHHDLDVKNFPAGSVVQDPHTNGLFEVPIPPKNTTDPTPKPKTTPEPVPPKPEIPEPTPKPKNPEVQQTTDWSKEAKWILDTWGFGGGHATHIGPKFRASSGKTLGDLTIKDIEGFSKALEGNFPSIKKDASDLEKQWLDKKTAELGGGNLSPVQKNKVKDMSIYEIQKEITP